MFDCLLVRCISCFESNKMSKQLGEITYSNEMSRKEQTYSHGYFNRQAEHCGIIRHHKEFTIKSGGVHLLFRHGNRSRVGELRNIKYKGNVNIVALQCHANYDVCKQMAKSLYQNNCEKKFFKNKKKETVWVWSSDGDGVKSPHGDYLNENGMVQRSWDSGVDDKIPFDRNKRSNRWIRVNQDGLSEPIPELTFKNKNGKPIYLRHSIDRVFLYIGPDPDYFKKRRFSEDQADFDRFMQEASRHLDTHFFEGKSLLEVSENLKKLVDNSKFNAEFLKEKIAVLTKEKKANLEPRQDAKLALQQRSVFIHKKLKERLGNYSSIDSLKTQISSYLLFLDKNILVSEADLKPALKDALGGHYLEIFPEHDFKAGLHSCMDAYYLVQNVIRDASLYEKAEMTAEELKHAIDFAGEPAKDKPIFLEYFSMKLREKLDVQGFNTLLQQTDIPLIAAIKKHHLSKMGKPQIVRSDSANSQATGNRYGVPKSPSKQRISA